VSLQVVGQAAITYLPVMNTLFQTAPIGLDAWLRITLVATLATVVVSLDKARIRSRTL
jgi:cation-transporting P-type ATPase F